MKCDTKNPRKTLPAVRIPQHSRTNLFGGAVPVATGGKTQLVPMVGGEGVQLGLNQSSRLLGAPMITTSRALGRWMLLLCLWVLPAILSHGPWERQDPTRGGDSGTSPWQLGSVAFCGLC